MKLKMFSHVNPFAIHSIVEVTIAFATRARHRLLSPASLAVMTLTAAFSEQACFAAGSARLDRDSTSGDDAWRRQRQQLMQLADFQCASLWTRVLEKRCFVEIEFFFPLPPPLSLSLSLTLSSSSLPSRLALPFANNWAIIGFKED